MHISKIEASGFLSFDLLSLPGLDPALNVVVGPNGAGKTNLFRLLRMISDALYVQDGHARAIWEGIGERPGTATGWSARITLEFDGRWEERLFTAYFQGALATRLDVPREISDAYQEWVSRFSPTAIRSLFSGTLEVACSSGPTFHWTISYRFDHEDVSHEWLLDGGPMQGIRRAGQDPDTPFQGGPLLFSLLGPGMPAEALFEPLRIFSSRDIAAEDILPGVGQLVQPSLRSQPLGPVPEPLKRFGQLAGVPIAGAPYEYSGIFLFQALLRRGLTFLGDIRPPIREKWRIEELAGDPESIDLSDGADVVLYLFLLKNGGAEARAHFRSIQGIFSELTRARFDVGLATQSGEAASESSVVEVHLLATVEQQGHDVPLSLAGAGLRESLFLSVDIAAPEHQILCLDEPALNLHPSLQRNIAHKLKRRPGQTVLITHSPYLLSIQDAVDLTRILRFHSRDGATQISRLPPAPGDERERWSRWIKEMGRGSDGPALLFGRGVILVEGETEAAALPIWFAKSDTAASNYGSLEDNNTLLHWVGGGRNLSTYVTFLEAFEIPSVAVCDGDQLRDPTFRRQFGLPDLPRDAGFDEAKIAAEANRIFTLSNDWDETFEDLAYVRPHLAEARQEVGDSKVRQGRHIAVTTECPQEVNVLYRKLLDALGIPL